MSAPEDVLKQLANAEGTLANAILAPLGIQPSQRPPTPLEVASKAVSGGNIPVPGAGGTFKLPPFPKLPGLPSAATSTTPSTNLPVAAQAGAKLATTASYF